MSEAGGFIVIHRKIIGWGWYTDSNTKALFLHCLLKANYEDKEWKGIKIKRGSFITSLSKLSIETGMSIQSVRTSLSKLESTGEVTNESTNRYRLITVVKYDDYQTLLNKHGRNNKQTTSRATSKQQSKQQSGNKQVTTTNNINNINNKTIEGLRPADAKPSPETTKQASLDIAPPGAGESRTQAEEKVVPLSTGEWFAYCESRGSLSESEIWRRWEDLDNGRLLGSDRIKAIREMLSGGK